MDAPVLLVTDDTSLAPSMTGALKSREMDVVSCEPARSISTAGKTVPALVLLDLEIKSVACPSVLTALLMEPRTRGVPVIGVTRATGGQHVLAVVAGMHDVLSLPLDAARLEQLSNLIVSLGFQFGSGDSEPGSASADRLVLYAERAGVSGVLERGPVTAPLGQAAFAQGALASCRFAGKTGRAGLSALLAARGELRFTPGGAQPTAPAASVPIPEPETIDATDLEILEPIEEPPEAVKTPILAVDDDPEILGLITAFLQKAGFDVRTASDGEEGFVTAIAMRPEAIVSDLEMPRLDGWGFLKKVRADHRIADTPLVFLSAAEDFRMSVQATAAGAQDYISKDGARGVLAHKLNGALAPRRELEAAMRAGRPARTRVELTGTRWTLLMLASLAPKGSVIVADGFGVYEIAFENGVFKSADATVAGKTLTGDQALEGYLGVRSGDLVIAHATRRPANFTGAVSATVEAACLRNNAAESLAITKAMSSMQGVIVDPDLCDLYAKFGPAGGREIAAGLRAGKAPLDMLATSKNPVEAERILRDMARRRVILVGKS